MARSFLPDYVLTRKAAWLLLGANVLGWALNYYCPEGGVLHELGQLLAYGTAGMLVVPHLPIWESTE